MTLQWETKCFANWIPGCCSSAVCLPLMILALFALKSEMKNYAFPPFCRFCPSLWVCLHYSLVNARWKYIYLWCFCCSESDKSSSYSANAVEFSCSFSSSCANTFKQISERKREMGLTNCASICLTMNIYLRLRCITPQSVLDCHVAQLKLFVAPAELLFHREKSLRVSFVALFSGRDRRAERGFGRVKYSRSSSSNLNVGFFSTTTSQITRNLKI